MRPYATPSLRKSIAQLAGSVACYLGLLGLMGYTIYAKLPYVVTFLLTIFASGFLVRIFIIFHDCTHLSYFRSRMLCRVVGHFCGILAFTPYAKWQRSHAIHHGTVGNLDRRGTGDVWTLTLEEYQSKSRFARAFYRFYRHPFFLLIVAPALLFFIQNRLTNRRMGRGDIVSLLVTDMGVFGILAVCWLTLGLKYYLVIFVPTMLIAAILGVWLFYIQHQFPSVYWARTAEWDHYKAALQGSSYYQLPPILRWFSGSIGYHHIHHLNPRIPNYNLKKCYTHIPELQQVVPITLLDSFKLISLRLYDEKNNRLIKIPK